MKQKKKRETKFYRNFYFFSLIKIKIKKIKINEEKNKKFQFFFTPEFWCLWCLMVHDADAVAFNEYKKT